MCAFIVILGKRCCFCNMDKYNLILFFFFPKLSPLCPQIVAYYYYYYYYYFLFCFYASRFFFSTVVLEPTVFPIPSALSKKKKKSFCFPLS